MRVKLLSSWSGAIEDLQAILLDLGEDVEEAVA